MKILKRIELSPGLHVDIIRGSGQATFVNICGRGYLATFTLAEARALFGALRDLDGEGLLS